MIDSIFMDHQTTGQLAISPQTGLLEQHLSSLISLVLPKRICDPIQSQRFMYVTRDSPDQDH